MDELRDGNPVSLPYALAGGDDINLTRAHQRYDVYVNNEFVGHKTLLKQVEDIDEVVGSFLRRSGVSQFTAELDDNLHYKIAAPDEDTQHQIRHALTAYLDTHETGVTTDQPGV